MKNKVIPLLVVIGLLLILLEKLSYVSRIVIPTWDGCVYLTNARDLFALRPLYEHYRPPFLSFIIGVIWVIIGREDYLITRFIHPVFTICSGLVFYFIVQKERGATFAMLATFVFMLNSIVLLMSNHLLTHGLTVFFLLLGVYFLMKEKYICWYLGGLFLGLTILSRYPSVILVLAVFPVIALRKGIIVLQKEVIVLPKEKLLLLFCACIGVLTSFTPWYIWNMVVYGNIRHILRFPGPAGAGTLRFTPSLFYVWNALAIFNTVIILVFISLVQRSTYKDERNHLWLSWFISSFVFWSAVSGRFTSTLDAYRFTFEWMPAVGYLSIIPLERVWRAKDEVKPKINSSIVRLFVTGLLIVLLSYGVASSYIGYYKESRAHTFYFDDSFFGITNYLKENTREDDIIVTNDLAPVIAYFTGRYTTMSWTAKDVNEWKSFIKDVKGTVAVIFVEETGLYSEANITRYEFLEFKTTIRTKYYPLAYIFTINYNGW